MTDHDTNMLIWLIGGQTAGLVIGLLIGSVTVFLVVKRLSNGK